MAFPTAPVELARRRLPAPEYTNHLVLGVAAETLTIPPGVSWCRLRADATCWFRVNGTAAAPTGDVTDGTGVTLLPANGEDFFRVRAGMTVSVIADGGSGVVTANFYRDHSDV